ncbi:FRG domain-containing protein [Pelolinea submarina]|uniref:FRG domain-containing protein n=1 Tax=Pelolinea submarina TaxID=913107 RepID=A0A3E0AAD3_9CHLR|nr:FRG domain-containing protein [Pelolinea submarina]REG08462.1 FRG domain-containing protein [Pelolinea submarina]
MIEIITDIKDLIQFVLEIRKEFRGEIWWRGQGNINWKLQPSISRTGNNCISESNLNVRFMARAPSRCLNVPNQEDFLNWLFLMRHHGLPTRLLDWTESPLIACFFAVEQQDCNNFDGSISVLNPYLLDKSQFGAEVVFSPISKIANRFAIPAFDASVDDYEKIYSVYPNEINPRMLNQMSVFTIHGNGIALEDLPDKDNYLRRIRIKKESKAKIYEQIDLLGIRESNLFPDLDRLSSYLKKIVKVN